MTSIVAASEITDPDSNELKELDAKIDALCTQQPEICQMTLDFINDTEEDSIAVEDMSPDQKEMIRVMNDLGYIDHIVPEDSSDPATA